ncbi:MAG: hypothetical protein ABEJ25_07560 [Candidatus Bipolaricaulia bacterium]
MSNTKLIGILVLALVLGFGGGYLAQMVGGDTNVTNLSEEVEAVKSKLNNLQGRVEEIPQDFSTFASADRVSQLKQSINNLQERVKQTGTGITKTEFSNLRGQVKDLQSMVEELKSLTSKGGGSNLKVGFVNATEAFDVFKNLVQEERRKAQSVKKEIANLRAKATKGKITRDEYKKQSDILQAEKLKAQLNIDLAMINKMIEAKGFNTISNRLKKLQSQVKPIMDELEKLLKRIKDDAANPQEVSQKLSQIQTQYEQLDQLLTKIIEGKIFEVTNNQAAKKNYDLVFRQENVVLYRNSDKITNLTDTVKKELESALQVK